MSRFVEAQRQQELLAALLAPSSDVAVARFNAAGDRAARGLAAYRANGAASAERALAAVFGSVQAMLGEDDFRQLAREFWRAEPPQRGDLAEWGAGLPGWLAAHEQLAAWPYLADSARLDLARHHCERAADAEIDLASLALLESADPAHVQMLPMPGMSVLRSVWPIAAIHAAHQGASGASDDADARFAAVREAMAAQRADAVLIARRGWRAEVHLLTDAEARWAEDLIRGASLAEALDHAGEQFDFGAWLAIALREPWLKGLGLLHD